MSEHQVTPPKGYRAMIPARTTFMNVGSPGSTGPDQLVDGLGLVE